MKQSHFDKIQVYLNDARAAITAHHNLCDQKIRKYNSQEAENAEILNVRAMSFETEKNRFILQGYVEDSAATAADSIEIAFSRIDEELTAWAAEPPADDFMKILNAVDRFNLPLDADEIVALSEKASGSYIASKILSGYAEKNGMAFPFMNLSGIRQQLRNVKSDCLLSVYGYAGGYENIPDFEWITSNPKTGKPFDITRRLFAAEYITREESSLTRLQEILSTATNSKISLAPAAVERINELFKNTKPEDRLNRMRELLVSHPELSEQLSLYDHHAYKNAQDEIRQAKLEERENALAALREASERAVDAQKAAVLASL